MNKKKITENRFFQGLFKIKTDIDIGTKTISWFTGKLPEIASVIAIFFFLDIRIGPDWRLYAVMAVSCISLVYAIGLVWRVTGMYHLQEYAQTYMNPPQKEILETVRKIDNKINKKVKNQVRFKIK